MWILFLVVTTLLETVPGAMAQGTPGVLPTVLQHAEPIYPPLALQARIQGDVLVKVTTDGESVREAEAETGHPLLRRSAEENARTWKFAAHSPSTFHVTFRYRLLSDNVEVEFLQLPAIVEIKAPPPQAIIDYASIGLGTWKAQLKSAHGKFSKIFRFSYSGPDGDWLNGNVLGPKDEEQEIDFGHKEGDFLAFTIALTYPDRQHTKTFFVGKMSTGEIIGTFVDETGIRGEWKAVRTEDRINSVLPAKW